MYPRNAASPEPIAIGVVLLTADGTIQTSGVTVRIKPIGVSEADGAGTIAYSTDGIVLYTPTQAETNYTSFILIASKTGCIPTSITIITTASATPGTVKLSPVEHTGATIPLVAVVQELGAEALSASALEEAIALAVRDELTTELANLSNTVWNQVRHRLGIDGTRDIPVEGYATFLGHVIATKFAVDSSSSPGQVPISIVSDTADLVQMSDLDYLEYITIKADGSGFNINLTGNLIGKVLGAGSGTITGTGVRAELASGEIEGIVTELLAKDVIAIATVLSGSSASVLVSTSSSELLIPHYLRNCLMVITDITNGNEQVRWIASHIEDLDTGYMTITPDEPFGFTPAAGDTIKIYRTARWTGVKAEDVATIKSNTDNALRTGVPYTHTNDDTSESVSVTITPSP